MVMKRGGVEIIASITLVLALVIFLIVFFGNSDSSLLNAQRGEGKNIFSSKQEVSSGNSEIYQNAPAESYTDPTSSQIEPKEITVNEVQQKLQVEGAGWKAKSNEFTEMSIEEQRTYLGLDLSGNTFGVSSSSEEPSGEVSINLGGKIVKSNMFNSFFGLFDKPITGKVVENGVDLSNLPDNFDWRDAHGINYITPVKNQGGCGSCWAFATMGLIESQTNIYYNHYLNLNRSEQELISCFHTGGCNGLSTASFGELFEYLNFNGSLSEGCFPYQTCDALGSGSGCNSGLGISCSQKCSNYQNELLKSPNYFTVPFNDINSLKKAIVTKGPVEAGMAVYQDFYAYSEGIYSHVAGVLLGYHAVLIVGYGEEDGIQYWIVKNSWGQGWGEEGYFRIAIGDESGMESLLLYAVDGPTEFLNQTVLCLDSDQDGYCYWGTAPKPNTCPSSCDLILADCDDSNPSLFESCGKAELTGSFNITSSVIGAKVYVKDLVSGEYIFRGKTKQDPLNVKLNEGQREIKVVHSLSQPYYLTINVTENSFENIYANLTSSGIFQMLSGWPQEINPDRRDMFVGTTPLLDDLDGDGKEEIIVYSNDRINVWNYDGTFKSGWPQYLRQDGLSMSTGGTLPTPSIGDIDGDGAKEIFLPSYGLFQKNLTNGNLCGYAFEIDGSNVVGWQNDCYFQYSSGTWIEDGWSYSESIIEDLDNDGKLEIIVATGNPDFNYFNKIYVLYGNSSIKPGWPIVNMKFKMLPLVYDIDQDGKKEVISTTRDGFILVYSYNGSLEINKTIPNFNAPNKYGASLLRDFANKKNYYGLFYNGNFKFFDLIEGVSIAPTGVAGYPGNPAIFDIDGNGIEDLIYEPSSEGKIYAVNMTSWKNIYGQTVRTAFNGFPVDLEVGGPIKLQPTIVDVNSDGMKEILITDMGGKVFSFNLTGGITEGFPLDFGELFNSGVAVGDVNGDGNLDMFFGSGSAGGILYGVTIKTLTKSNSYSTSSWGGYNANSANTRFSRSFECSQYSLIGDANADGQIGSEDYLTISEVFVKKIEPYVNTCCLDVTNDGTVNSNDALQVARYLQNPNVNPYQIGQIQCRERI